VTGYEVKDEVAYLGGERPAGRIVDDLCRVCPFVIEVTDGYGETAKFLRYECRAGSQPPNHETTWRGSLEDKCTIQVDGLDHNLMEDIRQFCIDHPELGAAYNADCMADCRRTLSISCSSNKKGIAAKRELIDKFFPTEAAEQNKGIVDTFCGDCELGKPGELADHVRCSFNGRLMRSKHETCPKFVDSRSEIVKKHQCGSCNYGYWYSDDSTYVNVVSDDGTKTIKRPCETNTHYCYQFAEGQKKIASDKDFDPNTCPEWCPLESDVDEGLFDEQICRVCGCTDDNACEGGCYWVEYDLCSKCAANKCEEIDCPFNDSNGFCCFGDEDQATAGFIGDIITAIKNFNCQNQDVLLSYKMITENHIEEMEDLNAAKAHKPRCPYLSSHGEKFIDCNAPNARRLNTINFDSKSECNNKVHGHCYDCFMDCEDYRKYYADSTTWDDWAVPEHRTNFKVCIHCCNNSWHTDLPEGYSGQEYCFCQVKQVPVKHDASPCEWFNRHPDWPLPRTGTQGCRIMKDDCPCFCDHNDGCSLLIAKGNALKTMVNSFSDLKIDCAVFRDVASKVAPIEQQKPEMCKDCNNGYEGGCIHPGRGDTCIAFIKPVPGENLDSPLASQLSFIRQKANDILGNYVEIGYALIDIRDKKLYKAHGYSNLIECVEAELNMKKSTAYNLMKVAEKFGDASTRRLLTEYGEYNYVQCLEMSTMTEKELSMITPDMSKREMKKLKDSNRLESEPKIDAGPEAAFPDEGALKGKIIDITDFKVIGAEASAAPPPHPSFSDHDVDQGDPTADVYSNNATDGTLSKTSGVRRPVLSQTADNEIDHKLAIASSCLQYSVDVLKSIENDFYNENDANINNQQCIEAICSILTNLRILSNTDLKQTCFDVYVNDTDVSLINRIAAADEKINKLEISLKQSQDAHKSKNDMHKDEVQYLKDRIKETENKLSAAGISSSNDSEMIEFDNCSTV
jgi:hypothetical protein